MDLSDGHWTCCMLCTAFPWDLLQKGSSSDTSRGEGAGTWVKFPTAPHSSSLEIQAGNREWWCWDQPALGKLVGWILKASDPSWKRGKQTGRGGAGSTSSVGLCPWGCLLLGSLEGNGEGIAGMAPAVLAEEHLVCPSPGNSCNNIFSCCFPSLRCLGVARAGKVFGVLGSVVWGFARCFSQDMGLLWASLLTDRAHSEHRGCRWNTRRTKRFSSHDGSALLSSGVWHHLLTQRFVPNLLLSPPKLLVLVMEEPWGGLRVTSWVQVSLGDQGDGMSHSVPQFLCL